MQRYGLFVQNVHGPSWKWSQSCKPRARWRQHGECLDRGWPYQATLQLDYDGMSCLRQQPLQGFHHSMLWYAIVGCLGSSCFWENVNVVMLDNGVCSACCEEDLGLLEHKNVIMEMRRFGIVPKRWCGDMVWLCCSWKLTSSNAKTSSLVRLIPTFTNHTMGIFDQYGTYFFLLPFMQQLMSSMQSQKYEGMWLLEQSSLFRPL